MRILSFALFDLDIEDLQTIDKEITQRLVYIYVNVFFFYLLLFKFLKTLNIVYCTLRGGNIKTIFFFFYYVNLMNKKKFIDIFSCSKKKKRKF